MAKTYSEKLGITKQDVQRSAHVPPEFKVNIPEPNVIPEFDVRAVEEEESRTQEASFDTEEVTALARESMDFLAAIAMPLIFKYLFPPVFKAVWDWLLKYAHQGRTFPRLALGLPRGFGKTTVIKLFILYCILFTKRSFIAIICETEGKAVSILADVMDMLNEPNIQKLFGDWRLGIETDNARAKKFGFRGRNIIIKALGAGSSIRGVNEKNLRPDVMIFDDIQSREESENAEISKALMNWLNGTAMKAKNPEGCMYLFIANMYPTVGSLLRKLKSNHTWTKFICGGILANGTSLWEDLQPIEQLMDEFASDLAAGCPEVFYAEVLNDENASANVNIDFEKLPAFPFSEHDIPQGNFIVIDPGGNKKKSDDTSIGYFEVFDEIPVLRKLTYRVMSPGETIFEALKLALQFNCHCVAIESNAYQASLGWWFAHVCEQKQITGIDAVEIFSGVKSKNSRILQMFRSLAKSEIFLDPSIVSDVKLQAVNFNPLKIDNTDGLLDLLTYAPRVVQEFGEFIIMHDVINMQEFAEAAVMNEEDNAPF